MIKIKGIENGIAAKPLIPGDATVAVHVVEHEDLLHGMTEGLSSLDFRQSMSQHAFEGFDRLAESLDAFTELVGGHAVRSHHGIECGPVDLNLGLAVRGVGTIELAIEPGVAGTQLIEEFG